MAEHFNDDEANEHIRLRALEIFPTGYMAVVSIIQGVALAGLATSMYTKLGASREAHNLDPLTIWIHGVVTWITIWVVVYMYIWFTIVARWAPDWSDSFVPIALGTGEVAMGALVDSDHAWHASAAVTAALGSLAFMNSILRIHSETMPEFAFRETSSLLRLLVLGMSVMAILNITPILWKGVWFGEGVAAASGVGALGSVVLSELRLRKILAASGANTSRWNWSNLRA